MHAHIRVLAIIVQQIWQWNSFTFNYYYNIQWRSQGVSGVKPPLP